MTSSIPQSTSTITVSVGQDVRLRHGVKPGEGEVSQVNEKKPIDREETQTLQVPKSAEQIQGTLVRLQETLQQVEPRIELSVDKELNLVVFRVLDKESGELIRQIPSEEVLDLERFFADQSGLFIEEEI